MALDKVQADITQTPSTVSVTAVAGGSGQALATTASSSIDLALSSFVAGPVEYKVGSGAWIRLDKGQGVRLAVDLSATAVRLRKAVPDAAAIPVGLTINTVNAIAPDGGVPIALGAGGALGPYATVAALQTASPAAANAGKHASVGAAAPYVDYVSDGSSWNQVATEVPSLRQAATRCFPANNQNASFSRGMAVSWHIATSPLNGVTVEYYNGRLNGQSEQVGLGAGTLDVAIEYPIGSGNITRAAECVALNSPVPWAAGACVTLTFPTVKIPQGAAFTLRSMQRIAAGIQWTQVAGGSNYGAAPGDFMDIGTSDTIDKVMGGTVGASNGICFFPLVIASMTTKRAMLICGTSRETDGVSGVSDYWCDLGPTARSLMRQYGYTSFAAAGTLLAQWNAGTHTMLNSLIAKGYWTDVINEHGVNDLAGGDTPATLVTRRTAFANAMKAVRSSLRVCGQTIYPYVTSSDVFMTKSNQAQGSNQPKIAIFNDYAMAGIAGEDWCWDTARGVDAFREGRYPVSNDPSAASRTAASFTAGISGTTMTVSAIASGTINQGDPLYDSGGLVNDSTYVMEQLTGTAGGVGTYRVNKAHSGFPLKSAVPGGTTISTAGWMTRDGLHCQLRGVEAIVRNCSPALLAQMRQPVLS